MATTKLKMMKNKRLYLDEEVISLEDLKALPEYSVTIPTGVTIGKRWRCATQPFRMDEDNSEWLIKTYTEDPHNDNMALICSVWAVIEPDVPHRGSLR